jgi:hypothetical protein
MKDFSSLFQHEVVKEEPFVRIELLFCNYFTHLTQQHQVEFLEVRLGCRCLFALSTQI